MNSDMELSLLNNDFKTYLSYAIDDLCNKSNEILNKLKNFHKINITYNPNFSNLNDCEGFLEKLKEKLKEIRLTKNDIDQKILDILIYDEENKNKLKLAYEKELEKLDKEVIEGTKDSENIIHAEEDKMKIKLEEKENLILNMSEIGQDQESIINNFEKEELLKADLEYNKNIEKLNKKYIIKEQKFEYTNDEIKLKNKYLEEIQKIKSYSNNPFYNNLIVSFGLNQYLN
jgi:hypothetical protein